MPRHRARFQTLYKLSGWYPDGKFKHREWKNPEFYITKIETLAPYRYRVEDSTGETRLIVNSKREWEVYHE